MTEANEGPARRILVAIDTAPHESTVLEAATELARELRAELHGLFIEDINLFRLAGLPFAREIDYSSGTSRPLDTEAIERALRHRAEGVRQAIADAAQRLSLHWSFRTSRGSFAQTMLTESLEADLLLVGREKTSPTARATAHRGPIMMIDDDARSRERLFETTKRLARQHADTIVVLLARESADVPRADALSPVYVQRCPSDPETLLQTVQQWGPQLLLLDRSSEFVCESTINLLVSQLPCPLVLVQ